MKEKSLTELAQKAAEIAREVGGRVVSEAEIANWPEIEDKTLLGDTLRGLEAARMLCGLSWLVAELCDRDKEIITALYGKAIALTNEGSV